MTAAELLKQLLKLKLDLIPIKPGAKLPLESAWNKPTERKIHPTVVRFARATGVRTSELPYIDIEDLTRKHANIGVLNEPSHVVTLDCDSPQAGTALTAAAAALGGDMKSLYAGAAWTSVKGMKVLFRRPRRVAATRSVLKVWNGKSHDVIFELRGTGQDVLPPSWREDAQITLAWVDGFPASIPPMPKWLIALYEQMAAGKGAAIDAMYNALGVSPEARNRSRVLGMDAYPSHCAGHAAERGWVVANYPVPELLTRYGYVKVGTRWRPGDSNHAAGIIPPRQGHEENWLCEHESDPLAGIFDAWRLIVELEFNGDADACAESVKAEQRRQLKPRTDQRDKDASDDGNDQGSRDHHVAADNRDGQRDKIGRNDKRQDQDAERNKDAAHVSPEQVVDTAPKPRDKKPRQQRPPVDEPEDASKTHDEHDDSPLVVDKQTTRSVALPNDFFSAETAPIVPIISGLLNLTPGAHLLSGMPKCGKSTLSTAIAITAASGSSVSGFQVDAPVPVLYLALDESVPNDLQPRMLAYLRGKKLAEKLIVKNTSIIDDASTLVEWATETGIDAAEPLPFEVIDEDDELIRPAFSGALRALYWYIELNKIKLTVVDVVNRLRPRTNGKMPVYDRDMMDFLALNQIGLKTGCAIVGLHHMNKDAAARNASTEVHSLAKVSGSNAIAGAVQSVISMTRPTGRGIDQDALYNMQPIGKKIIIDHISRDGIGLDPTALSLVATEGSTQRPMLEWTVIGRADLLVDSDNKTWVREWLYAQPPDDYHSCNAISAAAMQAGVISTRGKDGFRLMLNKMRNQGILSSSHGPTGGYRLSAAARADRDGKPSRY